MVDGLADTRAQMMVISSGMAQRLGVRISEMMPISMNIMTMNGNSTNVIGGILIMMIHSFNGRIRESKQLVYVATGVNQFVICRAALCDL